MVEAVHIYKTDKESTLKIISKYTQITDPDSLDRTYQAYIKNTAGSAAAGPGGRQNFPRLYGGEPAGGGQGQS